MILLATQIVNRVRASLQDSPENQAETVKNMIVEHVTTPRLSAILAWRIERMSPNDRDAFLAEVKHACNPMTKLNHELPTPTVPA